MNDATREHMMQPEITTSLDSSVSVPLRVIDSDADSDLAFPRLDVSEPEAVSRFLVKIHDVSGRTTLLEVSGSDTVADVKRRIATNAESIVALEFAGETLVSEWTLSSCGVVSGSELSVQEYYNDGSPIIMPYAQSIASAPRGAHVFSEAELRGLVNKARVRVLHSWNGVTADGQSIGLSLHVHDLIMVGKIVNEDWYEGYQPHDLNQCGYIPRNYVEIESLYDEDFRRKLGPDGQKLPGHSTIPWMTKTTDQAVLSTTPLRTRRVFCDLVRGFHRVIAIFRRKTEKPEQKPTQKAFPCPNEPKDSRQGPPPLPPSPFPPKPPVQILDLFQRGSRVRVTFHLEHDNPDAQGPIVRLVLSLVSAPEARIVFATVELQFEHDIIADLEPKRDESAGTEVRYEQCVGTQQSLTGGAGYGPATLSLTAGRTENKLAKYSRRTRGMVVGDGKGSSRAYWVFTEDTGEAARFGLDPEQNMAVMLHVRPVRVDYQINAKVVMGDGKTGGWLNTKRMSSGRQRYYFRG